MEEEDQYESISSEKSIQRSNSLDQIQPQTSTVGGQCVSRPIVFPQEPKELPKLFKIYQKNAEIMRKLREEVASLEEKILEELRLKNAEPIVQTDDEGIQEIDLNDYKIAQFEQKRKQRRSKLHKLSELYDSLRKVNRIEGFLFREENQQKMLEKIKNIWQVLEYRVIQNSLIVLTKHQKGSSDLEIEIGQERALESSNIFVSEQQQVSSSQPEQHYTVAVFSLQNLVHLLSPNQALPQLDEQNNKQKLERTKEEAQMCRTLSKKVNILSEGPIYTASFSHKHELVFAAELGGKLSVMSVQGKQLSSVQFDEIDKVLHIEAVQDELFVGTADGVGRIYQIKQQGHLKLSRIFMCYSKTLSKVFGYKALGKQTIQKVHFCLESGAFEYNLKTNIVSQIARITEQQISVGLFNPALSHTHISAILSLEANQRKNLSLKMSESKRDLKEWIGSGELIYVLPSKGKEADRCFQLLKGDSLGGLEFLTF